MKMKKIFLTMFVMLLCLLGLASCGSIDKISVNEVFIVSENTIVGTTDKIGKYLNGHGGELVIPEEIDGTRITGIGEDAFANCKNLKTVVISSQIKSIGFGAFRNCNSLKKITVPFVGAGQSMSKLQQSEPCLSYLAVTDDSATPISFLSYRETSTPEFVFLGDKEDKKDKEDSEETSDGEEKDIFEGNNGNHFGYIFGAANHKKNKDAVPESLTDVTITGAGNIEEYAFYHCESIETVDLNYAAQIAENAFEGCDCVFAIKVPGLSEVLELNSLDNLPRLLQILADNLSHIGTDDFAQYHFENGCMIDDKYRIYINNEGDGTFDIITKKAVVWGNKDSTFPENGSVEMIAGNAFCDSNIEKIILPAGIELQAAALAGTRSLKEVQLPSDIKEISDGLLTQSGIENIVIPDGVSSIGGGAFSGCEYLSSITIPSNVKTIGAGAFAGCCRLEKLELPDGITRIEEQTFLDCYNLKEVNIPESVEHIGVYAFAGCGSLTKLTIPESVEYIGDSAFFNCCSLTITIPVSVKLIYMNAFNCFDEYIDNITQRVCYEGTMEQWNQMSRIMYLGYRTGLTIHCTDGDIVY